MASPTPDQIADVIRAIAAKGGVTAPATLGMHPNGRYDGTALVAGDEWRERGEAYGNDALLIVVHEGSDIAPFFSYDAAYRTGAASDYAQCEAMTEALGEIGVFYETCTTWYSAVYPV